jgi:hypothetical protein
MATVILYAFDLEDLTAWVGRRDTRALEAARKALHEDEEADWEREELKLLDGLLSRMVMEGILYRGLAPEESYYLTQLLIDLFDEFVDSEAVCDDWPMQAVEEALAPARRGTESGTLAGYLLWGRILCGTETLWSKGDDLENLVPYFGYVTQSELPALATALDAPPAAPRPPAAWRALRTAIQTCIESERDLLSLIG